jgi:ABC-type Fe3+-hydroxamate transport system substrate-binding protein
MRLRGGEVIYNMLKLKAPDFVQKEAIDSGKQLVEISMEMLSKYANVDHIFICMNDGTTEAQVKEILESPIWKTLPAVKNNKVHMLDYPTPQTAKGTANDLTFAVSSDKHVKSTCYSLPFTRHTQKPPI